MCVGLARSCKYCGISRHVSWNNCKAYWNEYRVAVQEDNLDARPVPEDCDVLQETFKGFPAGTCPRLADCPSLLVFEKLKKMRAIQAAQQAARQKAIDDLKRKQEEEFANNYFQKKPVPRRSEAVPFMEMASLEVDDKAKKRKATLQKAKETIKQLKSQLGIEYSENPFDSESDDNNEPENKTAAPAGNYSTKSQSARDKWETRPEARISQPVSIPQRSKGSVAKPPAPAPQFFEWEQDLKDIASGSGSFATTVGSHLTAVSNSSHARREASTTPPTELADTGACYSSSNHDVPPEFFEPAENDDNEVPLEFLGVESGYAASSDDENAASSDSPLFPNLLSSFSCYRDSLLEAREHQNSAPNNDEGLATVNEEEEDAGYDADVSDVGDNDHAVEHSNVGHDGNNNSEAEEQVAITTTASQKQTFAAWLAKSLVRPPPGLRWFLGRPKHQNTPPNFRNIIVPSPATSDVVVPCAVAAIAAESQNLNEESRAAIVGGGNSRFWHP